MQTKEAAMPHPAKQTTTTAMPAAAALAGRLEGSVHLPGEEAYREACTIWNSMIKRRPVLVVRPRSAGDVGETVRFARESGLPLSVRGGGHNVAGAALSDGGITIDMSQRRGVTVDAERQSVRVEPGATWKDVDAATQPLGLVVPSGIISATGVAGFTLGAGFGWTSRKLGFAADNLKSAEVVTADGEVRRASAAENHDLFWALRGGSGNFGVVTEFDFRAHKHGPEVTAGIVMHPFERARDVMRLYRDVTAGAPDELTCLLILRKALPAPNIPQNYHGELIAAIMAHWTGDPAEGAAAMRPLKAFGAPIVDNIGPKPFTAFQTALDGGQPFGRRYYWKSAEVKEVSDGLMETLVESASRIASPFSAILMMHMGGAPSRVPAEATAVGIRAAEFGVVTQGAWEKPEDDEREIGWVRNTYSATRAFGSERAYVNFLTDDETRARIDDAYDPTQYERLRRIKGKYDPGNLFSGNLNIPPI
jgi:FAD/FMN-containing dehydrogenase